MFCIRNISTARLLGLVGGLTLSCTLAVAQPPANAQKAVSGVVRIQSTAPATLPEVSAPAINITQPGTDTVANGIVQVNSDCGTGTCASTTCSTCKTKFGICNRRPMCAVNACNEVVLPKSKAQPTDPCGPIQSFGPEMPVMPVNRNTGRGSDGLGFADCRLPRVAGEGTGVTFNQCLSNSINVARTPAIMQNPNGTFTRMAFERQRLNALAEYFVIYKEEFEEDGKTLTASGVRHLCGIAKRFESCRGLPIQVEIVDAKKEIGENRKLTVVDGLMKLGFSSVEAVTRVQAISYCGPRAEPLRYDSIERIGNAALNSDANSGGTGGFGGGFGGGAGGFGGR